MALLFSSPVMPGKMNDSGHSNLYSSIHSSQNPSPSPEMYMESQPQPLDFSTKDKNTTDDKKTKHTESSPMDRASPIGDHPGGAVSHSYLLQHLHRQAGAEFIPEDAHLPPGRRPPPRSVSPMVHSPVKQEPHCYSSMVQDSPTPAINPNLFAYLQANPALLPKFHAILKSKIESGRPVKSRSPSPPAQAMAALEQVYSAVSASSDYRQLPPLGLGGIGAGGHGVVGLSAGGHSVGGPSAGGFSVRGFAGGLNARDLAVGFGAAASAPSAYLSAPGLNSVGSMDNLHTASFLAGNPGFFGVQDAQEQLAAQSNADYDKFRQRYYASKPKGKHVNRNRKSRQMNYDLPVNNATDNNVPTDGDHNNSDVRNYNYDRNERLNDGEAYRQSDSDDGYEGVHGGARPKEPGPCPSPSPGPSSSAHIPGPSSSTYNPGPSTSSHSPGPSSSTYNPGPSTSTYNPGPSTSSHDPGPSTSSHNPSKKRERPNGELVKDEAYLERRRKNNEAAKRSRDSRRLKEEEVYIRCNFLQQENAKLKCEIQTLKIHTEQLRNYLVYGHPV